MASDALQLFLKVYNFKIINFIWLVDWLIIFTTFLGILMLVNQCLLLLETVLSVMWKK